MGKEKFIYNKNTLRYEKAVIPLKIKIVRGVAIFCGLLIFALTSGTIASELFPSQKEVALERELNITKSQIEKISNEMVMLEEVVETVQSKDKNIYRVVLEADPIDNNVWNGGTGGVDKYKEFDYLKHTGTKLKDAANRLDRLSRKIDLQAKSMAEIEKLALEKEKVLASIPSIKPVREDKLNRKIQHLSGFGYRIHPIHKVRKLHKGIDFSCKQGTPIYATGDGIVKRAENRSTGYGKNVIINHGYDYQSLYAHMSKMNVKAGQKVKRGEIIGYVGSTGTSTAPHLHYEVHYKGSAKNPINFVLDGLTTEEYKTLVEMAETQNQSFD